MHVLCTQQDMFFISLTYMHACAHENDDIETVTQSTQVCTRHVHDNLHEHVCMSFTYMPNLVHMDTDVYMNRKPRMTV